MNDTGLLQKLREDLDIARTESTKVASETADGGSCCNDCVHIPVGKIYPLKRRSKALENVLGGYSIKTSMWNGYNITPPGAGVASRRNKAAEVMAQVLSERGWRACVYYQVD